ncbi:MAG: tyrosine-protein phosphatase [Sphaerochaetaceae bacterium]|nr:tyrosine-protein phosphatase [Sphaerochaetaceae bacterium]
MKASLRYIVPIFFAFLLLSCATGTRTDYYEPHTELQIKALENYELTTLIAKGEEERSLPLPYFLDAGKDCTKVVLDWGDGREMEIEVEDGKARLINLLPGETYHWTGFSKEGEVLREGVLEVSPRAPRNIEAGGVTNIRDAGYWKGKDGKTIKGEMIYRSSRLSENGSGESLLTEDGKTVLLRDLGIKTEIDLRKTRDGENGGIEESVLGDGVRYCSIPMESGGGYLKRNLPAFSSLFEVLGDIENYPIVIHCSIGTDRTGAVAFVLGALLGMEEDDLYRDYLFSNFGAIGGLRRQKTIDEYLMLLDSYEGSTLAEKARRMLIENGTKEKDIDLFLEIMEK